MNDTNARISLIFLHETCSSLFLIKCVWPKKSKRSQLKKNTRDENGKLTDSAQHCLLTKLIKRKSITRNEKKMKQKTKGIVSKN